MNVLAIGAHYDDIELGAGGAIAKHIDHGDNVFMAVVTHSGYTSFDGKVIRLKETALKEGQAAAAALGVKAQNLISLNYETKDVKYGSELIETLDRIINDNDIELIYTHWIHDVHQDHSAIGRATLNASRHTPRVLMYRSNWYKSTENFGSNFFVDISGQMERKIESLNAHVSETTRRGPSWVTFVKNQNRTSGIEMGTEYAEAFELVKWIC